MSVSPAAGISLSRTAMKAKSPPAERDASSSFATGVSPGGGAPGVGAGVSSPSVGEYVGVGVSPSPSVLRGVCVMHKWKKVRPRDLQRNSICILVTMLSKRLTD